MNDKRPCKSNRPKERAKILEKLTNVAFIIADPLLQKNLGMGSPFNVSYQNCCKKTFMSMILKI
jgi:hypothetical protein